MEQVRKLWERLLQELKFGGLPDLPKCIEISTISKKFGIELLFRTDKTRQTEVRSEKAIKSLKVNLNLQGCAGVNAVY